MDETEKQKRDLGVFMEETITIERMGYGSEAVGRLESGKAVFVEGGAPGDVAALEIVEDKPTFARARIARLEEQIAAGVQFAVKHPASAPASAPAPATAQKLAPAPQKAAEAPTESAKPAEEAPLPWDEPPLPDDYDAPPPYGEPVAPAPKAAAPKPLR